jgi:hypothetical protein
MKTFYVTLTSEQLPPIIPNVLDHWFFLDPVNGLNFSYPATASGDIWAVSALSATYTAFVCGGEFFPWGYQVVDQTQFIVIPDLKGDTTIVFVPSGIDITYHDILKIVYDPGNGEQPITINRPIISQPADFSGASFTNFEPALDSPIKINQAFNYYTSGARVTYYPKISALYGDMTRLIYGFEVNIFPNSIYDIDNVHLIAATSSPEDYYKSTCVYEIESENIVTLNVVNAPISGS